MEERGETETETETETEKMEMHQQLFKILEALNRVSRDSSDCDSSAIKALLLLRTASSSILVSNPNLFSLSQRLSQLADSVQELHNSKPSRLGLVSFVTRRVRSREVSRLAAVAETELQPLIDREIVSNLTETLAAVGGGTAALDEDRVFDQISAFQARLARGFSMNLQDLLLKSGVFSQLEWVLCNPSLGMKVREKAAISVMELLLFNKDVFVGSVLMGGSVEALVSMGNSLCSLQVLSALIKAIKSPLVDEMEFCGGILKIVGYLSSVEMRAMAMDCVMEIGYFGRKEAVETMINGGVIKRLVELQRSNEARFARCVARFVVQLEVGEGLRQREKRAFKQVILNQVREACVSEAECATIVAELLWGSSP